MKIEFDLHGSCCNEYPWICIMHNDNIVYQGHVEEQQVLEFDLPAQPSNRICMAGLAKRNGENGKWDTMVDDQGRIVKDKNIKINDIRIESISMGMEWIKNLPMHQDNGTIQPCMLGMYANGRIDFVIQEPVLSWIIEEKFIKHEQKLDIASHQRSGQARFEYGFVTEKIQAIKKLMHAQNSNH